MVDSSYNLKNKLNKETLLKDRSFLRDAGRFLIDRGGYSANDLGTNEDKYDAFMEHFRSQNVNEVTALKDLTYAQETDGEGKAQFGRLMDTYDKMDSDFGFKAAGDYLEGIFTAPSTYAGAFSFGTAKVGALAANQGIKLGVRQALRTGIGSAVVEGVAGGATVAAQEGTRVETGIKEEMNLGNIGLATAISAGTGGVLGGFTGYTRGINASKADEILKSTKKIVDDATEKSHADATVKTLTNKTTSKTAKKYQEQLLDSLDAETKKLAKSKKKALIETIPEQLAVGKELRKELSSGNRVYSIGAKEIQNIAAAASEVFHKIGDHPTLDDPLTEAFTSRVARGLADGVLDENSFGKILNDHNITTEQLGGLYAAELSSYGLGLRSGRMIKDIGKQSDYQEIVTRLNEIDENTLGLGTITSKSREVVDALQETKGVGAKIGSFFTHINKARIGFMTIQPATTMRNTTNGYLRNYVYMLDNFGASVVDYAKGNIKLISNPNDAMVRKHSEDLIRKSRAQARAGFQSLHFQDLKLGMESVNTKALFELLGDKKLGNTDVTKKLLRKMGDIADVTDQTGGLIGVARNLNKLNTMSDNMFKRAIFSREVDKALGANPISVKTFETGPAGEQISKELVLDSLDKVLRTGNFNKINAKTFADSMTEAFDFTYQTAGFRGREGKFNKFADLFIDVSSNSLLASSIIPFPKYLINQFRFLYEHTPILGVYNMGGILNKSGKTGLRKKVDLSSDTLGKQLGGLAILGTFMAARANFGDEYTSAYEYNDPTSGGTFNAEALIGPFSAHAAVADVLYRINPGKWHDNENVANTKPFDSRRLVKAMTGGNIRAGTSLDLVESLVDVLNNGIDSGESELKIQERTAKFLGNYLNTFTVGAGFFKDIQAQIDPSVRQLADNTDVNMMHYFFKQAGRSLPTMGIDYGKVQEGGRDASASSTRSTGTRKLNPILKQLSGLTPVEEKTSVEKELARLQFDYFELSPKRIKFDKPMTNDARQLIGTSIEKDVAAFIKTDEYYYATDVRKRDMLKTEIDLIRRTERAKVLDPESAPTKLDRERVLKAKYFNLSNRDRVLINDTHEHLEKRRGISEPKTIEETGNWAEGLRLQDARKKKK